MGRDFSRRRRFRVMGLMRPTKKTKTNRDEFDAWASWGAACCAPTRLVCGLITPGGEVGSGGGGFFDALQDHRNVHGVVVQAREIVRLGGIAVPAVFGAVAVFYLALVGRVRG